VTARDEHDARAFERVQVSVLDGRRGGVRDVEIRMGDTAQVKRRVGSYASKGFEIGAAIDIACGLAVLLMTAAIIEA